MSAKSIQLTERDLTILELVRRHRLLTIEQIASAVSGSRMALRKRCALLAAHQYLAVVYKPKPLYYRVGRQPRIWGLGKRAGQVLDAVGKHNINWRRRNREASPLLIDHTLLAADLSIRFENLHSPAVQVIDQEDILIRAPQHTRQARSPLGWSVSFSHLKERNISTGVVPDRLLALHFPLLPERRNTLYFLLEADRGTEPIERASLTQGTSIVRKFLCYGASLAKGIPQSRFNIEHPPRILFVTQIPGRVHNMVEAFQRLNTALPKEKALPANAFLFAATDTLSPEWVLSTEWLNGLGGKVVLARQFTSPQSFLSELDKYGESEPALRPRDRAVYMATTLANGDPGHTYPVLHAQASVRGTLLHLAHEIRSERGDLQRIPEQLGMRGFQVTKCSLED
jgi:hypothetical protein